MVVQLSLRHLSHHCLLPLALSGHPAVVYCQASFLLQSKNKKKKKKKKKARQQIAQQQQLPASALESQADDDVEIE